MDHRIRIFRGAFEVEPLAGDLAGGDEPDRLDASTSSHFNTSIEGSSERGWTSRILPAATVWVVYATDVEEGAGVRVRFEPRYLKESPLPTPGAGLSRSIFATSPATLREHRTFVYRTRLVPHRVNPVVSPLRWTEAEAEQETRVALQGMTEQLRRCSYARFGHLRTADDLIAGGLHLSACWDARSYRRYAVCVLASDADVYRLDETALTSAVVPNPRAALEGVDQDVELYCFTYEEVGTHVAVNERDVYGEYRFNVKECSVCGDLTTYTPPPKESAA